MQYSIDFNPGYVEYNLITYHKNNTVAHQQEHREDGPSTIFDDGDCSYMVYGLKHRIDGPAFVWKNNKISWFYQDKRINCSSQEQFERIIKLIHFK